MKHNKNTVKRKLLNAILFLFPIALIVFYLPFNYEQTKLQLFLVFSIGLGFINLFRIKELEFSRLNYIYLLWVAVLALASFFGIHPFESFIGGSYRHQGVLFFVSLLLWQLSLSSLSLPLKSKIFAVLVFVSVGESLLAAIQKMPVGTIGEPNALAGFLLASLVLLPKLFKKKKVFLIVFIIITLGILSTGSRLAVLILPLVFFGWLAEVKKQLKVFTLLLVFLVILFGIFFAYKEKSLVISENRFVIWEIAIEAVKRQPILGFGAESNEEIYDLAFYRLEKPLGELLIDRSHNLFLDVALWSGLLGVFLFTTWLVLILKNLYKKDYIRFVSAIVLIVYSFFQPLSVIHWVMLIYLLF